MTRHKKRQVSVIEAAATDVDPSKKTVTFKLPRVLTEEAAA